MTRRSVLIASDSFKGTIDSLGVAQQIRAGWLRVFPRDTVEIIPVADGGEGTLDALHHATPGSWFESVQSVSPQGDPREARWLNLGEGTGVVELAETCGLGLTEPLQPLTAHTREFGRVIAHALASGITRLVVAIGGSASTDGGMGMLVALGARFTDIHGRAVPLGGGALALIDRADLSGVRALPARGVVALVDVTNPLTGPSGAARVFGPQKGATPEMIEILDAALARFASLCGGDPDAPGSGAAGGTGYALQLWGASMCSGAEGMAELLGLRERILRSDVVITGEGAFDAQTADGKLPAHVLRLARASGRTALLVAGSITAQPEGFASAVSLSDLAGGKTHAMKDPRHWLEEAGAQLARTLQ